MEVTIDYHFDGKREVLYEKKAENIQDLIALLHETKDVADKHFTNILNEGEDIKGEPSKKKKTSENDLDGDDQDEDIEEENDNQQENENQQDNKIDEEIN